MNIENLIGLFNDDNILYGGAKSRKTNLEIYDMIDDSNPNRNNLMKTLFIPLNNNCSTTISVGIFIKAGSNDETEAFGIAHFLEHMTFNGTKKRDYDSLMLQLDKIGCSYNAMTSNEFTLYYISGNPDDIELILDIIIDLYLNPTFPEESIKKERKVVIDELNLNKDRSYRVLGEYINTYLYKGINDALARPVIGFKETISQINRQDILNFRNKFY